MKRRLATVNLVATLLLWLGLAMGLAAVPARAQAEASSLQRAVAGDWQYHWGPGPVAEKAWRPLGSLREPPDRRGSQELWLRLRLPEAAWQHQSLFIHEMNHVFTASVGEDLLYRYGTHEPGRKLQAPGLRWHMIPLPERHAGQTLVLHAYSDDIGYIGPFGYVGVGTPEEHLVRMIRRDADRLVVAALSAFLGLFALVVYFGKRRPAEYVYFALFAVLAGVYALCRTEIRTFFWDAPWFWMRLEIGSMSMLPTLLVWHLRDILHGRFARWLWVMGWACAVMAAASLVLDAIGLVPCYNSLHWMLYELVIVATVVMVMAAWSAFAGLVEARLVMAGVFLALLLAYQSSLASLKVVPWQLHLAHWAILLLIVSLGVVLIRRFILTYYEVERDLKDRDAHLSAIINALPDSFLLTHRDGRILDHRLRTEDLAALAHGEPLGQLIGPPLAESLSAPLSEIHAQAPAAISVFEVGAPGGRDKEFFEVRVVPVGLNRCLALLRNITDRKRFEQMSRDFVAMVSHELRTPLTVIRGTLGLLEGETLSPSYHELVVNARSNTERLTRLVNDLLDSQMIEAGHFTVHPRPVSVATLVEQAISLNRPFAEGYQVELVRQGALPDLVIEADPDRMIQALTNLLTNAIKFSRAGEAVTVSAEVEGDRLKFSVTDCGPGVPEAFRDRLFHKFTQADSSSTRSRGGSGLGLSITKAIVELHGGEVAYSSTVGAGSTFQIELPLPDEPAEPWSRETRLPRAAQAEPPGLHRHDDAP